jgi:hypothetical protein
VKDTSIDGAIRNALGSYSPPRVEACPDESVLAAYVEMKLGADEVQSVERHASDCPSCRQTLGLALQLSVSEEEPARPAPAPDTGKRILFRFSLPFSMAALLVLALLTGVVFYRLLRESARLPAGSQTAEARLPGRAESISAAKSTQEETSPRQQVSSQPSKPATRANKLRGATAGRASESIPPPPETRHEELLFIKKSGGLAPPPAGEKSEAAAENRLAVGEKLASPSVTAAPAPESPLSAERGARVAAEDKMTEQTVLTGPVSAYSKAKLSSRAASGLETSVRAVSLEPAVPPVEAVRILERLLVSGKDALTGKKISGRTFFSSSGYWIDARCVAQAGLPYLEAKKDESEGQQVLKAYPELEKLLPAIIQWKGRNLVLR